MSSHNKQALPAITVAAIGVVFGDIGTSPLYALKEIFNGHHPIPVTPENILGILSMVLWSIVALVSVKYVAIIMRADNRGEGGSLALLALVTEKAKNPRLAWIITLLGIFAAALFYGDSMITPAISVLSAVEGLEIITPDLKPYVIPITLGILTGLFFIQKHGTGAMGKLFGPVMVAWFAVLAILGVLQIVHNPAVLHLRASRPRLPRARLGGAGCHRRRSAVHRHGPLRPLSHSPRLVWLRHAGPGSQLFWSRRTAAG